MGVNVGRAARTPPGVAYLERCVGGVLQSKRTFFLYETSVWNGRLLKTRTRRWIGDFLERDRRPLKILAYGDGLGFDSLYLAQREHDVSYFEVSQKCQAFAGSIFERAGASVRILTASHPPEQRRA